MKAAVGHADRVASGSGTVGSNAETASYARAPTAPPVNRGMPSTGDDAAMGRNARSAASGSAAAETSTGSSGSNRSTSTGRVWRSGAAVADLEQPARADAEERVAAEALAALDGLEEVGRAAVVEAQERADRRLEVGRARGAQQDGVGGGGEAFRLAEAERIAGDHVGLLAGDRPQNQNDLSSRDERSCLPRCHPHSAMPHSVTDGTGSRPTDRRCPVSLALCAGAYWSADRASPRRPRVRSGGSRVHSPSSPSRFAPATGSLFRRPTGTRPVHCPCSDVARRIGRPRDGCQPPPRGCRSVLGSGAPARRLFERGQRDVRQEPALAEVQVAADRLVAEHLDQERIDRPAPPAARWSTRRSRR